MAPPVRTPENLLEPPDGAVEEERPDEQDDEDDVGEGGREVDDLPARLDPLRQAREHDDPRQQHAQTEENIFEEGSFLKLLHSVWFIWDNLT